MRVAEAAVLVALLNPASAQIAELLQLVQGVNDGRASVLADRVKAADRKRPRLGVFAQAEAKQAQRFQAEALVFENLVFDPRKRINAFLGLECVARFSSPLFGGAEAHAKFACAYRRNDFC